MARTSTRRRRQGGRLSGPTPSRQPRTVSGWRKALYAALVTVAFFVTLEVVLASFGIAPTAVGEDPYVGFASYLPLFVEASDEGGSEVLVTAPNKLPFFNRQSFAKHKPADTARVFCLGGSTTYGRPYDDATSFCGWLRELLAVADSSRRWEVVNAGGISYASYRVTRVAAELLHYQPDLFIVYTGHNEFLERRTYAGILETPEPLRGLGALASHSRTHAAVGRLVAALTGAGRDSLSSTLSELPAEVNAVLDDSLGPDQYRRDDALREQVLSHFRFNLDRLVESAHSAGVGVVLIKPASNLRHCAPFKSQHRDGLDVADRSRSLELSQRAARALGADRANEALTALDRAVELDDRHARLHFLRGQALYALARFSEAKEAFVRAAEEDVCPLRAPARVREVIIEVATRHAVPLVDFVSLVEDRAEHGIPGEESFLDHVHPTVTVNRQLALALLDELFRQGIATPDPGWSTAASEVVRHRVESRIDPVAHATALRNLAKVLTWAGKYEEAYRLARAALEAMPDDGEAHYLSGVCAAKLGRRTAAIEHYRRAIELRPDDLKARNNVACELGEEGDRDAALAELLAALESSPDDPRTHHNLGLLYQDQGRLDLAASHFQEALRLDPGFAEACNDLGVIAEGQEDLRRAETLYRHALRLDPDYSTAHNNLGALVRRQGRLAEAAEHFSRAVELRPDSPAFNYNLGDVCRRLGEHGRAAAHLRHALALKPDFARAADDLAWILATSSDQTVRDGAEAVSLAQAAAELTGRQNPLVLDTLAAALAEQRDFETACAVAEMSVELVQAAGRTDLAAPIEERLLAYRRNQPWRDTRRPLD